MSKNKTIVIVGTCAVIIIGIVLTTWMVGKGKPPVRDFPAESTGLTGDTSTTSPEEATAATDEPAAATAATEHTVPATEPQNTEAASTPTKPGNPATEPSVPDAEPSAPPTESPTPSTEPPAPATEPPAPATEPPQPDYSSVELSAEKLMNCYYKGKKLEFPEDPGLFLNDGWVSTKDPLFLDNFLVNPDYPGIMLRIESRDTPLGLEPVMQTGVYGVCWRFEDLFNPKLDAKIPDLIISGLDPYATLADAQALLGLPTSSTGNYEQMDCYWSWNRERYVQLEIIFIRDRITCITLFVGDLRDVPYEG